MSDETMTKEEFNQLPNRSEYKLLTFREAEEQARHLADESLVWLRQNHADEYEAQLAAHKGDREALVAEVAADEGYGSWLASDEVEIEVTWRSASGAEDVRYAYWQRPGSTSTSRTHAGFIAADATGMVWGVGRTSDGALHDAKMEAAQAGCTLDLDTCKTHPATAQLLTVLRDGYSVRWALVDGVAHTA